MKYQWVLFDADHTLFDFDSFTGLNTVLAQYGISLTRAEYDDFQRINQPLWTDYQNGKIGIAELSEIRFAKLAARAGITPLALNARLQQEMAHISRLLPHARETLDTLKAHGTKLGIITNGYAALQQPRLDANRLSGCFDLVEVSETVGIPKPDARLFAHALKQMGNPDPRRVLMVGDSLLSDITGGNRAGMDTCWFNPHAAPNTGSIIPTYEIRRLNEVCTIAFPKQAA